MVIPSLRLYLEAILTSSRTYGYIRSYDVIDGYVAQKPYLLREEDDKKAIQTLKRAGKGCLEGVLGEKAETNVFVNKN